MGTESVRNNERSAECVGCLSAVFQFKVALTHIGCRQPLLYATRTFLVIFFFFYRLPQWGKFCELAALIVSAAATWQGIILLSWRQICRHERGLKKTVLEGTLTRRFLRVGKWELLKPRNKNSAGDHHFPGTEQLFLTMKSSSFKSSDCKRFLCFYVSHATIQLICFLLFLMFFLKNNRTLKINICLNNRAVEKNCTYWNEWKNENIKMRTDENKSKKPD